MSVGDSDNVLASISPIAFLNVTPESLNTMNKCMNAGTFYIHGPIDVGSWISCHSLPSSMNIVRYQYRIQSEPVVDVVMNDQLVGLELNDLLRAYNTIKSEWRYIEDFFPCIRY
jgi:hypothetical protein